MSLNEYQNRPQTKPPRRRLISPIIAVGVIAFILLFASFFAGVQYQKGKSSSTKTASTQATGQFGGANGPAGGFARGDRAIGTVTAVSNSSITIQSRRGTSATYLVTSSTTVTNGGSSASLSDIQSGDTVFITLDSSNTKDASNIALNPSFGGGMGAPGDSSNSSNSTDTINSTTQST